ncbi:hypothetical protein IP88_11280 [alpha proteobacterium AAP81b]|nr:hypothetical protein IP88_11280 [alpha proteobacterium AAP81b]
MPAAGADAADPAPMQASPFQLWLDNYRAGAIGRGLKAEWLDAALAGASFDAGVVARDRRQPDSPGAPTGYATYLDSKLPTRIGPGRSAAGAHRDALQRIAANSGVAPEILVAIWGIETFYGRVTGRFDLPSALASLAFDGRRAALFTGELDALVRIIGEGREDRASLKGSWAGAFGQPQFLPSSYLVYARDGDGDGRADIIASVPDSFASIAAYLTANGWQRGQPWGFRAIVPASLDRAAVANPVAPAACARPLSRHSRALPAADWRARGVIAINAPWPADTTPMTLVEPDGPGAGAFLVTANFRAIMAYNCSNYYALSVALLGDAVEPATR